MALIACPLVPITGIVLGGIGLLVGLEVGAFLLFAAPFGGLVCWVLVQALRASLAEGARVRRGWRNGRWTGVRALTALLIGWGIPVFVFCIVVPFLVVWLSFVGLFITGALVSDAP